MSTRFDRPHWKALIPRGGDIARIKKSTAGMLTLDEIIEEFKHCMGEQIGVDLSEDSEGKFKEITLSAEEIDQINDGSHPHLKLEDFPNAEDDLSQFGAPSFDATISTARLQHELENFFFAHLPSLIDQRKLAIVVNDDDVASIVQSIHETLHDYKALGIASNVKNDLSTGDVQAMLEIAFGDAVEFHRPRREVKR